MSIVNINVSVLYSSEGGENQGDTKIEGGHGSGLIEKVSDGQPECPLEVRNNYNHSIENQLENTGEMADNSVTLTYSPDSKKKNSKLSKNSSSKQSKSSQNNNTTNNFITNNLSNTNNSSSNKSKDSENTKTIKDVIAKRKLLVVNQGNNEKLGIAQNISERHFKAAHKVINSQVSNSNFTEEFYDYSLNQGLHSQNLNNSDNLKITNITNIIVGPKSFDIKNINNPRNEKMLRDIKALSQITQKALSSHCNTNPIDTIDDERRSFYNFQSKKEVFIDDNSDLPSGIGKSPLHTESSEKRIINIININNNYSIGNLNMKSLNERDKSFSSNYYSLNGSTQKKMKTNKSFKTMNINDYKNKISELMKQNIAHIETAGDGNESVRNSNISSKMIKKSIPRHSNTTSKESFSDTRQSFLNHDSFKEIIKSVKKENKKEKFVALNSFKK
jgi:hypothetical protein